MIDIKGAAVVFAWVVILYGLLLIVILIHELGHLLAGAALGFHIARIRVGLLEYVSPGWNLKLRWTDIFTGMVVLHAGRRAMIGTAWRYSFIVLAGPAINLLSAMLVSHLMELHGVNHIALSIWIVGSVLMCFVNLFPSSGKRFQTDGYQFCALVLSSKKRAQVVLQLTLRQRLSDFRAAYAAGSLTEASTGLDQIILAFDVLPELSRQAEAKQRFINLQERIRAVIAGQAEQLPGAGALPELAEPGLRTPLPVF